MRKWNFGELHHLNYGLRGCLGKEPFQSLSKAFRSSGVHLALVNPAPSHQGFTGLWVPVRGLVLPAGHGWVGPGQEGWEPDSVSASCGWRWSRVPRVPWLCLLLTEPALQRQGPGLVSTLSTPGEET